MICKSFDLNHTKHWIY